MRFNKENRLGGFYRYVCYFSFVYIIVGGLVTVFKTQPELIDAVTACKIGSLIAIIIANGEIDHRIDRSTRGIKWMNRSILFVVLVLAVGLSAKLLSGHETASGAESSASKPLHRFYQNLWWMSAFPLVAYGVLNMYIAYLGKGNVREKAIAARFFAFVYVTCVAPLLVVFLFLYFFGPYLHDPAMEYLHNPAMEVFTSGSMAVILLASAFATKAVEAYFDK